MLEKYWRTPEEEFQEEQIIYSRNQKHWDEVQADFPESIKGCKLSMDEIGVMITRAFITCPDNISEQDTKLAMTWLRKLTGKIEKIFREKDGYFSWKAKKEMEDENGKYEYMIFLEKTHPMNCEIKKVKKEVEVYESICK